MRRGQLLVSAAALLLLAVAVVGAPRPENPPVAAPHLEVWKSPSCGCCGAWVAHMERSGFPVKIHDTDDLAAVKAASRVPEPLGSCHTAKIDGYVIEGHVPAGDVRRLLAERPEAIGLSVPGMPTAAPGMDGRTGETYSTILFGAPGGDIVFARH